jgi:hypothetical protein
MGRLPTFIGIGAPKCATTWLHRCLGEHPDVFMSKVKETDFFRGGSIEGRLAEYEAHFAGAGSALAVGEFSTRYFASPVAPARIAEAVPGVKLIASLRNPVEQVYSHYWHQRRQNFHQWEVKSLPRSFEEAIERFPDALIRPALYHEHLRFWLSHFDRSRLSVLLHDDIVAHPEGALAGLYRFLGVRADFRPTSVTETGVTVRRGVEPRSRVHEAVHSRLHGFLARRVYMPLKQAVGVAAADRLKERLRVRQMLTRTFYREGYPEMRRDTRARLAETFADDVERLGFLLGRDLSHWR